MRTKYFEFLLAIFFIFGVCPKQTRSQTESPTPASKFNSKEMQGLSFEEIKKMAGEGDHGAQMQLVRSYFFNTKSNYYDVQEGVSCCEKFTALGNADAAECLGFFYKTGVDGGKDLAKALKYFEKAFDLGNDYCGGRLAEWYRTGAEGVTRDYSKSFYFYEKLAQKGNENAKIRTAEMYFYGQGVEKNFQKSQELISGLSDEDKNSEDLRKISTEMQGYKLSQPLTGNILKDHPKIPPFYIGRSIDPKDGEGGFKSLLVDEKGELVSLEGQTMPIKEWMDSSMQASLTSSGPAPKISPVPAWLSSPSGHWKILASNEEKWGTFNLHLCPANDSNNQAIGIPAGGWGWVSDGWNKKRDIFYLFTVCGVNSDRYYTLIQFDPVEKTFIELGYGLKLYSSPDGDWVAWVDGSGGYLHGQHHVHIYNVENNIDYQVTSGNSNNFFYKWSEPLETSK